MEFLGSMLAKAIALVVGKVLEFMRQRDLEKKAARAADLQKHVESMDAAREVEERILKKTKEANDAKIEELGAAEKLRRIRAWSARAKG
jgi:HAMP domain-containing protein